MDLYFRTRELCRTKSDELLPPLSRNSGLIESADVGPLTRGSVSVHTPLAQDSTRCFIPKPLNGKIADTCLCWTVCQQESRAMLQEWIERLLALVHLQDLEASGLVTQKLLRDGVHCTK